MKGKTEMKNKTVTTAGIEFDSRIFDAINLREARNYLLYPYFNAQRCEVVATDGYVMLIQQVDASESQKSGFVDFRCDCSPEIVKRAKCDFYKGKVNSDMSLIIDTSNEIGAYPDYPRVIPDADAEKRVGSLQNFFADGVRLYYPHALDILPDGTYKVTTKSFKKGFFVLNHLEAAFDYGLFDKFYKFFDYPDDADTFYTDSASPLLAVSEKERKTAVLMPAQFDYRYNDEFYRIEGKKTRLVKIQEAFKKENS